MTVALDRHLDKRRTNMNNYSKNKIKGATMVEYVLILGLISIAAVAILQSIGVNILALFTKVNTAIPKQ